MTAVQIEDLTLGYPSGTVAVSDLTLKVPQGEIFGMLGLNGAGKTSLIKTIATLMRPQSGSAHVFGLDIRKHPAEIKRRIGVVPQENNLDNRLDVRQNLLFHCRYAGIPNRVAISRVADWLDLLNLRNKARESVLRLSGGSKRKVMLAKAFITEPELLILDEPSAGLDPGIRDVLWARVREFRNGGGTVFLSTHYLEEAEQLCDRIGILHQGKLASTLDIGGQDAVILHDEKSVADHFRLVVGVTS